MSTVTMKVDVATGSKRGATGRECTMVATRLAAICDKIELYRDTETSLTFGQVATISAEMDDVAALATATTVLENKSSLLAGGRRSNHKQRMISVGSYEEECVLGGGGFGVVFKARHRATGQVVAVKSLRSISADETRTFLREACFMAACRGHPSLVGFHGVARAARGSKQGGYFIVMEYVGSKNLEQVIEDRGCPFPESEVRTIMRQLLDGAVVMHQHGIVHRDIKPGNIFVVDNSSAVKIGDMGVAKSMDEKTAPFFFAGTKGYMAPEMLLWNVNHDTAVDAWSLGCVMAELLAGKMTPFDGEDEMDQLYNIFDVVGVPGKKAWRAIKPNEDLEDEVQQWRARHRRLGHRNKLREMFPEEVLSRDGFEVLKGLLTSDPKKRLTAADALRCPWFADNNNVVEPPVAGRATTKSCLVACWEMMVSFAGSALKLFRPKGFLK